MMLSVHPEFDANTNTWFWNGVEASTLRELKELIGPQAHIKDYYPDGFDATVVMKFVENEKKKIAVRLAPPAVTTAVSDFNQRTASNNHLKVHRISSKSDDGRRFNGGNRRIPKHDHDKILDLWAKGIPTKEIARICGGGLTEQTARSTVMVARQRFRDPRAVRRISVKEQS